MILITGTSGYDILGKLCQARKAENRKYSLAWLCERAGIPAKSNLSDACHLRRKLNPKYHKPLARALGLDGLHGSFFCKLLQRDHEPRDAKGKSPLTAEIETLRKTLKIRLLAGGLTIDLKACELFAGFGLVPEAVSFDELRSIFPDWHYGDFSRALSTLQVCGFVTQKNGKYAVSVDQVLFEGDRRCVTAPTLPKFVHEGFVEGLQKLEQPIDHQQSHFESVTISVHLSKYKKWLEDFKERLVVDQSELEQGLGDAIIRLNVQCYPVRFTPKNAPSAGPKPTELDDP